VSPGSHRVTEVSDYRQKCLVRESEAEREREEGGGENKKKKKKKKNNRVILENSEELNYELSAIGWQSPTDLLAVLLFDAHPFD